jgi:hypothetical protein
VKNVEKRVFGFTVGHFNDSLFFALLGLSESLERCLSSPSKDFVVSGVISPEKTKDMNKFEERRIALTISMDEMYNHPWKDVIHHQIQPISEEFGVCALVAYSHVIGHAQDLINRVNFDTIAVELRHSHRKQLKDGEGFHTEHGFYHIDVLFTAFQRIGLSMRLIRYDPSQQENNTPQRRANLLETINKSTANIFIMKVQVILTYKYANLANNHFVVIKKVIGHDIPVLLDGLFFTPKLFCSAVLGRYPLLGKLYEINDI